MPRLSVIVPVYKVERYLPCCIDSILKQSFTDFELILVDDGSPDASSEICDRYKGIDNRVRVIHKANGGVSSARNLGLEQSQGEWIVFVDSDDYVGEDYLNNLIEVASTNDCQLVQAGFCRVNGQQHQYVKCSSNGTKYTDTTDILPYLRGFSISKLFKREIIINNNIRFDESLTFAEDLCFVLEYVLHIRKAAFIEPIDYYYVIYSDSASQKLHKPESLLQLWKRENYLLDKLYVLDNGLCNGYREWKVSVKNSVFSWIISWIIYYAKMPFDNSISQQLRIYYSDYKELFENYRSPFKIKEFIGKLIFKKHLKMASFLLYFISKYIQYKNHYEI